MNASDNDFYLDLLDNLSEGVYFVDVERRITYWNKGAENLTGRVAVDVTGLKCADNILAHVDAKGNPLCISGCPLAATILDGIPRHISAYMLHKKGNRVPVFVSVNPMRDESARIIGCVESFRDNSSEIALEQRLHDLEGMALVDGLTSIGNRRYADIILEERFSGLRRYNWPFGVIMCDIDNFKTVNDRYGHNAGDDVLKMVASTLVCSIRTSDTVFRWGGEEFLVVMANVDSSQLNDTAERICHLVAASKFICGEEFLRVTVSAGATLAGKSDSPQMLVQRADTLLYKSKAAGKNRASVG